MLIRALAVTAALSCAAGLTACGTATSDVAAGSDQQLAKGKPIVIGNALAATGFMKPYDDALALGARIKADELNAKGGILGHKITFVSEDTHSDATQGGRAAQKLLQKKADLVLVTCDGDLGAPVARVFEAASKISMGCAGASQFGAQGIGPLTYNFYPGSPTEGAVLAEWAHERGARRPYLLNLKELEYTNSICENFTKRWESLAPGNKIAGSDVMASKDTTIDTQISRLKAAKPDVVIVCSFPPQGVTAVKQLRGAGVDVPIGGSASFDGAYWLKGVPGLSNFYFPSLGSTFGDDPNPRHRELFQTIEKKTGERSDVGSYSLMGYSMIEALGDAVAQAGSTSPDAVSKTLDTFRDKPLMMGDATFTPKCHILVGMSHLMMEVQDGKMRYAGHEIKPKQVPPAPC